MGEIKIAETNRRELLKALGAATAGLAAVSADAWAEDGPMAAAIHHHLEAAEQGAVPAHAKFFQPQEFRTVERLADLILPSDGTPGAKDAAVAEFLDFYLAGSPDAAQMQFRKGLLGVEAIAKSKFGKPFVDLGEREQTQILEAMSGAGAEPEQRAFFQNVRRLTVFGFYTSKIGIKELGYAGNTYTSEFPGACTHQHEL